MYTTYLSAEERMDQEAWDEEAAEFISAAVQQLEGMDD